MFQRTCCYGLILLQLLFTTAFAATPIKNIIFDLGGVLVQLDPHATENAFLHLGAKHLQSIDQLVLHDYEIGYLTSNDFRQRLSRSIHLRNASNAQFDRAWNKMIVTIPQRSARLVKDLQAKGYHLYVFSNTNPIHYNRVVKLFHRAGISNPSRYFDRIYLSYQLGTSKPEHAGFKKILAENHLNPQETLFIDDRLENIKAAQQVGLQTYWMRSAMNYHDVEKLTANKVA